MTQNKQNLVSISNVDKIFKRGSEEIHVLGGLDLEIPDGEFLALMGPSGSGKSTLLNLIGGLDRPSQGTVEIGGERIDELSDRRLAAWRARHVGLVFQFYNLMPVLTAQKNVELPLLLTHLSRSERKKRAAIALDVVGLSKRNGHYPRTLSGGEQQRVGIARAIVHKPLLLLADEPTGNLDPGLSEEIMQLFARFNQVGTTVLIASHDLDLIKQMGSPMISLQDGKVAHNGLPFTVNDANVPAR